MLANLKGMLPGQSAAPAPAPAPAQPPPGAPSPEQPDQAGEQELPQAGGEGKEPMNEAEIEQMLFDEYLGAAEYSFEEFMDLVKQPLEEKGETEEEKQHWTHPRRWKVVLWNLTITNYMTDQLSVFVEVEFGGDREECKVQKGDATHIYAKGEDKNYLRTPVVKNVTNRGPVDMQFRSSFEYRGSYLDIEREKLKIKVWEYRTWTLNHLEAIFEEPLLSFATGETHLERDLYKFVKGRRSLRCRITCQLYFQELYDFELAFIKWRLSRLCSSQTLQKRVFNRKNTKMRFQKRAKTKRWQVIDRAKYMIQQRNFKKNARNVSRIASGYPSHGTTQASDNWLSAEGRQRMGLPKSGFLSVDKSLMPRAPSKLNKNMLASGSTRPQSGPVGEDAMNPYTDLILRHIQTLAVGENDMDQDDMIALGSANQALVVPKDAPTACLRISLLHSSSMNSGVRIVSTEQEASTSPSWDNLGEVYFRGTLRDLDTAYLEVVVEDTSASSAFRQIGYGQLPLRGVVGYPWLQMELGSPNWVSLQAKVEGWGELLNEWDFGWLEGCVMIAHTPRYSQLGEVYEVDATRVYLIVKVVSIDQIITADNRNSVDAYVEVSFDGTARRTRIFRNSLNPVWDDEVTVPLRFASTRDITYSDIQKKGKVYLDVWGVGTNYVDHLGGCTFYLHDIFFNEKNQKRNHVTKDRVNLETNLKSTYETRVFTAAKRLSFIHKDDRPSTLTFEAWTCPDILEVSGLDKLPKPERFDTKNNMPAALAEQYDKLKSIFDAVVEAKELLINDSTVGPPRFFTLEHLDQRKELQFVPTLVSPIKPPIGIDSQAAVFHYVRCVPFVIKRQSLTFSPDFTMQLNAGDPLDHCLLMASLLLGLPSHAFVCIGTLHDKHMHAWVATFHWDEDKETGYVKLWETASGVVYVLKNRFADTQFSKQVISDQDLAYNEILRYQHRRRAILLNPELAQFSTDSGSDCFAHQNVGAEAPSGGPKLPYRSLDIMFNHKNVWLNLQSPCPSRIWFDIWNIDYWHQFCPGSFLLTPCFIPKGFGTKLSELQFEKMSNELVEKVMGDLTSFRASRNLNTKWNRDDVLESFLQTGLELLHQANTARDDDYQLAKLKLEDWRKALYSKVPNSYRVRGAPLHYNTMDTKSISDSIMRDVEFLETRDKSATFAMAASMYNLPGELCSTYVYLLLCQKVTERERRRILAAKEQELREQNQRKARAKRMKYMQYGLAAGQEKHSSEEQEGGDENLDERGQENEEDNGDASPTKAEGEGDEVPLTTPAPADEKNEKKKTKVPKVKKRPPNISPESEVAFFEISRNYYEEAEAPDFKALMQDLEDSIAEALHISPIRVRGFQARYLEKRLVFAIQPDQSSPVPSEGGPQEEGPKDSGGEGEPPKVKGLSPTALMEALTSLGDLMVKENEVFADITGGEAKFVWDGPGSRPYGKEEDNHSDAPEGGETEAGLVDKEGTEGKNKKKKKKKKEKKKTEEADPETQEEPGDPKNEEGNGQQLQATSPETAETAASARGAAGAAVAADAAAEAGAAAAGALEAAAVGAAAGEATKKKKKEKKEKKKKKKDEGTETNVVEEGEEIPEETEPSASEKKKKKKEGKKKKVKDDIVEIPEETENSDPEKKKKKEGKKKKVKDDIVEIPEETENAETEKKTKENGEKEKVKEESEEIPEETGLSKPEKKKKKKEGKKKKVKDDIVDISEETDSSEAEKKQEKQETTAESPSPPRPKEPTPPPPQPKKQTPPPSSSSSSSSSSDEAPPPSPLLPPKARGMRVSAVGVIATAISKFRTKTAIETRSSSSSSTSETDSETREKERIMLQRLEDLRRMRQQLQQQETEAETDSLSLSGDVHTLNSNAELLYISDDEDEESDSEDDMTHVLEVQQQIERLEEKRRELDALRATLMETEMQLNYTQQMEHRAEMSVGSSFMSPGSSRSSLSALLPAPPPLCDMACVSKRPQPSAAAAAAAAALSAATASSLESPYNPLQQQWHFMPWLSVKEASTRSPSHDRDMQERVTPQSASREDDSKTPLLSPTEAAAMLEKQQEVLRQRVQRLQQQKQKLLQQHRRQIHQERSVMGFRDKPANYAYHRVKKPKDETGGSQETDNLLRGFMSSSDDECISEY